MVSKDFAKQIQGYGLTTAEIVYRLPDHKSVLQSYIWQNYDLFPKFPALQDFLHFWETKLEGPLYSVRVAHSSRGVVRVRSSTRSDSSALDVHTLRPVTR